MRVRARRGVAAWALAGAVSGGCVRVPPETETVSATAGPSEALSTTFEVVVWNVHKEREALEGELPELARNAELILLQEGRGAELGRAGEATQVVTFRDVRGGATNGVVTWSRAASSRHVPLRSDSREPLVRTPKSILVTEYALVSGASVMVANVHGINYRRAEALEQQLAALAGVLAVHTGPLVVAGDFNTWSRRRREVLEGFVASLGLTRVFEGPDAPPLDAVFVRGLDVQDSHVVDTRHSDHDALVVTLHVGLVRRPE